MLMSSCWIPLSFQYALLISNTPALNLSSKPYMIFAAARGLLVKSVENRSVKSRVTTKSQSKYKTISSDTKLGIK